MQSILSCFAKQLADEFPPKHVFIMYENQVLHVDIDELKRLDERFYFLEMDQTMNVPVIVLKELK